jgi:hypothetical protein
MAIPLGYNPYYIDPSTGGGGTSDGDIGRYGYDPIGRAAPEEVFTPPVVNLGGKIIRTDDPVWKANTTPPTKITQPGAPDPLKGGGGKAATIAAAANGTSIVADGLSLDALPGWVYLVAAAGLLYVLTKD